MLLACVWSGALTGDVAVVVGAVVVLQEGHQGVQEVMGTEQHQLLQDVWDTHTQTHTI